MTPPHNPPTEAAPLAAVGAACQSGADCQSGVCEGQGCGRNQGKCAARQRACTRDRRAYCGCDGKTFFSSGSCPGRRFARPGQCPTSSPAPALSPDGAACRVDGDCQSGVCEGQGCGDNKGKCMSKRRPCTMDLRAYCGCDGKTFRGSGTCPSRRFAYRGECKSKLAADGAACQAGSDCQSGICEGQGCGNTPGKCMPERRACTKDLRPYCGCDGKTFRSSGSCPGQRFAYRGECKSKLAADGAACRTGTDCQSGICEGQGCGKTPGRCMSKQRRCTMDLRPYCGCDGKTFRSSGSCPGRRFAHPGGCKPAVRIQPTR